MHVLIIGKNGNLGRELIKAIQAETITAWDREEIDITNEAEVLKKLQDLKPNVVFNCAAYTAVDKAEQDYAAAELLNGYAAGFVAKACHAIGSTLVHYSTGMVFQGNDSKGYNESSPTDPINAYGKTKLLGEELIQQEFNNYYLIRTEWLYAKPENETAKKSFNEIILNLAATQDSLQGVEDEVGKPTWAKDLAKHSWQLIIDKQPFGIYHLTNSGQASRLDWAKEILKINNIDKLIEPVKGVAFPRPAKRPAFEILNNTKLPEMRSWQEALTEYFKNS